MWKVVLSTVAISSIAGNGGDATLAQVNGLAGIGRSPIGDRFLSDLGNARIRKVIADAPPPPRPLPPPLDGTISLTASQSTLDALTTFTGSISLVNAAGYTSLLDLDLFAFKGAKGEKVKVTLAANPAGRFVNGSAVLTLAGYNLLKVHNTVLPNALSVTLSASGTYGVTVSEAILKTGTFSGAYCVTLESSGAAWSTFVRK